MLPFYLILTLGSMAYVQENSQSDAEWTKMSKCLDLLIILWGHTPRDRGTLLSSGVHHRETTPNNDSHGSLHEISLDPLGVQSIG